MKRGDFFSGYFPLYMHVILVKKSMWGIIFQSALLKMIFQRYFPGFGKFKMLYCSTWGQRYTYYSVCGGVFSFISSIKIKFESSKRIQNKFELLFIVLILSGLIFLEKRGEKMLEKNNYKTIMKSLKRHVMNQ